MSNVRLDMAGRPLPDRTYPAETGSEGYTLHERTLGQIVHAFVELAPGEAQVTIAVYDVFLVGRSLSPMFEPLAQRTL